MPDWGWVLIGIEALVVLALMGLLVLSGRRTRRLHDRFGVEYDRTLARSETREEAESELADREKRRAELRILPLSAADCGRYQEQWDAVQAGFVDQPQAAVAGADALIQDVLRARGYPVEDFDQRAADVSVDHPQVVENYREGHRLAATSADGKGSTEGLRQAMRHYRALFAELLETDTDEPMARERALEPSRDPAEARGAKAVR